MTITKKSQAMMVIAALALLAFAPLAAEAVTVVITNNDGPGEGFNDPTAVVPVGGNPGVTLGAQRLNAFTYAANIWGGCLQSTVPIEVLAQMNPQTCTPTSAILGSAGTTYIHSDFPGAPLANTWYNQALAQAIAGLDLNPGTPEINATFNSNLNGSASCLGGTGWYYGYDQNPGSDIDFITVVFHEIGHGIGFQTFQSSTGVWYSNMVDAYGYWMYFDGATPPDYPSMTNAQRAAGNIGDPNLVWDGPNATTLGNMLLSGGLTNGRVRLFGPNPYQGGSSLSHWSTALTPNRVMEPYYTGANHDPELEAALLEDTGWTLLAKCGPGVLGEIAGAPTVYTHISFTYPNWVIRLPMKNVGTAGVSGFQGDIDPSTIPAWMTPSADFNAGYGATAPGATVVGATYTIDLTGWPGGPFDVDVIVSYTDSCGNVVTDTIPKTLAPDAATAVPDESPSFACRLNQNVPNPFNPTTTITYEVPGLQHVSLRVYNVAGRLVRNLVDEVKSEGRYAVDWNGKDAHGHALSSGVYFYRLEAGSFVQTKRMVLLK